MLKQLPEYEQAEIVRSRDPEVLNTCDIVVDVGAEFNAEKKRFDHHQKSFTHTFCSLRPEKNLWNIKLSSAGLVYVHYGRQVIEHIVKRLTTTKLDEKLIDILYDKMYENFVKEIDAIDNGVEIADVKAYSINTNLSARVSFLNPDWNETDKNENTQFKLALDMVGNEFLDRIRYYVLNWYPAREIVFKAIENRFNIDPSGSIVVIEPFAPWKSHLFDLEKELNLNNQELKYAMYKDSNGSWRIQCIPVEENSFKNRLSLPSEWCGLRDQELSDLANIKECIFCHANGFIGGNKTYEGICIHNYYKVNI
jgi:uncharacterized UPF0160 family protein